VCAGPSEARISIRHALPQDAAAIAHCLAAAFGPYRERYTAGAFADTVPSAEGISERLRSMAILVAEDETPAVIGTIGFAQHGTEGHLRGMAVVPPQHGRGVAHQLLAAAENALAAQGCSSVTLHTTEPLEQAIRFYLRHGYRPSGRVSDFHGMRLIEYRKALEVC
jgi:GNAT superfamily N-acetyltransferase